MKQKLTLSYDSMDIFPFLWFFILSYNIVYWQMDLQAVK